MCVSNASTALPNHILLATYCTQALELASRLAEEMQSATLAENLPKATPIFFSISELNQPGRGSQRHSAGVDLAAHPGAGTRNGTSGPSGWRGTL